MPYSANGHSVPQLPGTRVCLLIIWLTLRATEVQSRTSRSSWHSELGNSQAALPSEHLKEKLHDRHYDKFVHPTKENDTATIVRVGLYINGISSIDEINMQMVEDVYLRQEWMDARLKDLFNGTMSIHGDLIDDFWQPDPYFPSAKSVKIHTVLSQTRAMYLERNGRITFSIRLSIELACPMQFENYPMDDQKCSLYIESYSLPSTDLVYMWFEDKPVLYNKKMELPKFLMEGDPTISNYTNTGAYRPGNWSGIQMDVHLHRQFIYYLIQLYIPSALVVIVSWVSFWLDVESAPARVSLGVLTVLTITTQSANANSSMPQVSYIKAMDVWLAACLGFVFSALLEYALATTIVRKRKRSVSNQLGNACKDLISANFKLVEGASANGFNSLSNDDPNEAGIGEIRRPPPAEIGARRVDFVSRILFPAAFIIFNGIYWMLYVYILTERSTGHSHGFG
ncbi:glycine receptor subunit alphaZ1-like isoform X2 [Lineus longissimus]|uniref:glycine receptor subunit alphaZ1-like isoform X2 n=1 Tax=Lineus longissimus TaxID=88925 RepID=UPI00315CD9D9